MRRVIVKQEAVKQMRDEMKRASCTETGGVLVGYSEGDSLVVTAASGPGPRAKLRLFSVTIDGKHAQQFCDRVSQESDGKIDYLGDWHCHFAFSITPSTDDHRAMEIMAEFEDSPTKTPISLIWAKYCGKFVTYVYTEERLLKKVRSSIQKGCPS